MQRYLVLPGHVKLVSPALVLYLLFAFNIKQRILLFLKKRNNAEISRD
jgi:hypothetical protein